MSVEDHLYRWLGKYLDAPQWIKTPLGMAYGCLPKAMRYGTGYRRFLAEAQLRCPEKLKLLADERLRRTLRWAAETVPAYAGVLALLCDGAPVEAWLAAFPLTTRLDLKRHPQAYRSTACPPDAGLPMQTSGSSSEPLRFLLERGLTRCKETAYIDSFNRRLGYRRRVTILSLRGRNVRGAEEGVTHSYDPIKRMLAVSPNHLTDELMPGHVEAARRHRVSGIQGYPSAVYLFANWLDKHPEHADFVRRVRGVQLFSETVEPFMLDTIRRVFPCPVLLHYGHSERAVMAASMPDDPRYFVWPLYGKVELIDHEGCVITERGVSGEIVVTGFDNRVMPFIRYRTGDIAQWSTGPEHPDLPGFAVLERIEGRDSDFIYGRDGRAIPMTSVGGLRPPAFARIDAVQYEQFEPGRLIVRLQAGGGLTRETCCELQQFFHSKFHGMVDAELREVSSMARTANGKLRTIVQHISAEAEVTHA